MGARTHGGPTGSCGLDPTMHWHKKKRSRDTRRQRGRQRDGGKKGARGGRTLDIIAAWWRAIRGSLAVGLNLLTILISLSFGRNAGMFIRVPDPARFRKA